MTTVYLSNSCHLSITLRTVHHEKANNRMNEQKHSTSTSTSQIYVRPKANI